MISFESVSGVHAATANRLRAVRAFVGISQGEFAERAGIGKTTYNNYETAAQRPSLNAAIRLRETYGISLDFIYCGSLDTLPHKMAVALSSKPAVSASNTSNDKPES